MSKNRELIEKYEKIRKLQEKRERQERQAKGQAEELEEILAVSRRAHEESGDVPLAPSSRLSGPATMGRTPSSGSINPEDAYSHNMKAARFASPEAFSRKKAAKPAVLDPIGTGSTTKHKEPPPLSAEEKRRAELAAEQARMEAARQEQARQEAARKEAARQEQARREAAKRAKAQPRAAAPEETRTMAAGKRKLDPVDYETTQVVRGRARKETEPAQPFEAASEIDATDPDRTGFVLVPQEPQEPTDPDQTGVDLELPPEPDALEGENTDHNYRYDRKKNLDELISKFAADVEVRMGEGRENTFLRKRSELLKKDATQTMPAPKPKKK